MHLAVSSCSPGICLCFLKYVMLLLHIYIYICPSPRPPPRKPLPWRCPFPVRPHQTNDLKLTPVLGYPWRARAIATPRRHAARPCRRRVNKTIIPKWPYIYAPLVRYRPRHRACVGVCRSELMYTTCMKLRIWCIKQMCDICDMYAISITPNTCIFLASATCKMIRHFAYA